MGRDGSAAAVRFSGPVLRSGSPVPTAGRCTPTLRPPLKRRAAWRLISHLSLNHLSLADYEDGADALREILKLYDFADSAAIMACCDAVISVDTATAHLAGALVEFVG